ncbi:diaminobutyrate-2-oxoglutarate transaminase [Burkholderiaceae bacterium]|nr:diaminobutyrate-2-oxoglutarate transaminase [Burkholderiaceae bacterium]
MTTQISTSLRSLGSPFWRLWTGESITSFGTQLVQFALGVWVYQRTGSVVDFAGVTVAGLLPQLLVMPIAGNIADRLDRRRVIIAADCVAALMSVALITLLWFDRLEVYHLYAFAAVASLTAAFQEPAARAAMGTLLPDDQLTRASGIFGISATTLGIVAPTIAGAMVVSIGLQGVAILDLVTFLIGATLIWKALAHLRPPAARLNMSFGAVLRDSWRNFRASLAFFRQSTGMSSLFFYTLVQGTLLTLVVTLAVPLILANHSPRELGLVLSFAAAGALVGNMLMVVFQSPERRMLVVLAGDAVLTLCVAGIGMVDSLFWYCVLEALACCAGSVGASCAFALWISKVPDDQRGSIHVVQDTALTACSAAVVLSGALLVDKLFEPALAPGQPLAGVADALLRVQNGRGIAFLFVVSGAIGLGTALWGLAYKPLRNLN